MQISWLEERWLAVEAEAEQRSKVITTLVADCQVRPRCCSRARGRHACWWFHAGGRLAGAVLPHSLNGVPPCAVGAVLQALMKELKMELVTALDQQIMGSLTRGAGGSWSLASLDASASCVGLHADVVTRLADRANELNAEKVGRTQTPGGVGP